MGDISLLAGSPGDAAEHYATAVDLARMCSDTVWCGAALSGLASAKVGPSLVYTCPCLATQDSHAPQLNPDCSGVPMEHALLHQPGHIRHIQVLEACLRSGAMRSTAASASGDAGARNPAIARVQAEDAASAASRASSGFGGRVFWSLLRQVSGLDNDIRALLADSRSVLRRRSVLPLMVRPMADCCRGRGCRLDALFKAYVSS